MSSDIPKVTLLISCCARDIFRIRFDPAFMACEALILQAGWERTDDETSLQTRDTLNF